MPDFMRMKCENPISKQSQIANQLGYSTITLQRYRNDINMLSSYKIQPNNTNKRIKKASNSNFNNIPHCEHKLKRPQMTSKQPQTNQLNLRKTN